jgi:hypothetical protein
MKYTTSGLTNDNRGSIGGITFSKNGNCNYARARTVPADAKSSSQLSVRALTAYLAQTWRILSRNEQLGWITLATQYPKTNQLGQIYFLSGLQLYMELNRNIQVCGSTIIKNAPTLMQNQVELPASFTADVVTTPGTEDIKINYANTLYATLFMRVMSSGPVSNGIRAAFHYKKISVLDDTFSSGGSILTPYLEIYGQGPITGEAYFFKAKNIDPRSGFSSASVIYRAIGLI